MSKRKRQHTDGPDDAARPVESESRTAPCEAPVNAPAPAPVLPLEEFEAVSGVSRVSFAGFRAWLVVNGHTKQRTLQDWLVLHSHYQGT